MRLSYSPSSSTLHQIHVLSSVHGCEDRERRGGEKKKEGELKKKKGGRGGALCGRLFHIRIFPTSIIPRLPFFATLTEKGEEKEGGLGEEEGKGKEKTTRQTVLSLISYFCNTAPPPSGKNGGGKKEKKPPKEKGEERGGV